MINISCIVFSFFSTWRFLERKAADVNHWFQLRLCSGEFSAVQRPEIVGWAIIFALIRGFQETAPEGKFTALSALVAAACAVFIYRQYRCKSSGKFMNHGYLIGVQGWAAARDDSLYYVVLVTLQYLPDRHRFRAYLPENALNTSMWARVGLPASYHSWRYARKWWPGW